MFVKVNYFCSNLRTRVAQGLDEYRAVMREVAGSNPDRINTEDLTEEKELPL